MAIPIPVDPSATPDLRGEPVDDTPAEVNEYKVRVIINGDVIDTLTFKYGETLSLTYMYKGLSVREWCYSVTYKHPDGHLYQRWFSALEENVTIKITKNQDIIGKSSVFYPAEIIPSNDSKATDNSIAEATSKPKETSQSNSKKRVSTPSILKYKKGTNIITIKGKKGTTIVVRVGKMIKRLYMKKKTRRNLRLDKMLKKGMQISIYAKKSGYKNSKIRVYRVKK